MVQVIRGWMTMCVFQGKQKEYNSMLVDIKLTGFTSSSFIAAFSCSSRFFFSKILTACCSSMHRVAKLIPCSWRLRFDNPDRPISSCISGHAWVLGTSSVSWAPVHIYKFTGTWYLWFDYHWIIFTGWCKTQHLLFSNTLELQSYPRPCLNGMWFELGITPILLSYCWRQLRVTCSSSFSSNIGFPSSSVSSFSGCFASKSWYFLVKICTIKQPNHWDIFHVLMCSSC